jgi:hypothetical protein
MSKKTVVKQQFKLTFDEFQEYNGVYREDCNPTIVEDAWVWHIEKALASGKKVPEHVLDSHQDICFDDGVACWRRENPSLACLPIAVCN